uniref:Uncharacterized protein n=1 Tax=Daucus carota subsp. sativus TaxID=79200 RepID=A0A161ZVW3_DAUCS
MRKRKNIVNNNCNRRAYQLNHEETSCDKPIFLIAPLSISLHAEEEVRAEGIYAAICQF